MAEEETAFLEVGEGCFGSVEAGETSLLWQWRRLLSGSCKEGLFLVDVGRLVFDSCREYARGGRLLFVDSYGELDFHQRWWTLLFVAGRQQLAF